MAKVKKILVVEDEPDLRELLKMNLESAGFDVSTAADGREGMQKALEEKPNLIVLDVILPLMNGYEICRELKKEDSAMKSTFVLLLTARGQQADRFWGMYCGADEFLTKPFDMDALIRKIQGFLAKAA